MGVFFCDFYFLAVGWGECESRTWCEGEDGALFILIPAAYSRITILILMLAFLLINKAIAELPDLLLCEMSH